MTCSSASGTTSRLSTRSVSFNSLHCRGCARARVSAAHAIHAQRPPHALLCTRSIGLVRVGLSPCGQGAQRGDVPVLVARVAHDGHVELYPVVLPQYVAHGAGGVRQVADDLQGKLLHLRVLADAPAAARRGRRSACRAGRRCQRVAGCQRVRQHNVTPIVSVCHATEAPTMTCGRRSSSPLQVRHKTRDGRPLLPFPADAAHVEHALYHLALHVLCSAHEKKRWACSAQRLSRLFSDVLVMWSCASNELEAYAPKRSSTGDATCTLS
jgi:hypothetical protein